jgi:urease accessory protein
MIRNTLSRLLPALAVATAASPALAHHPLGGAPMTTFGQGLLSGVGHPILGFDHLFFILIVGIAALYTGKRFAAPAAYIAAMLVGCLMMSLGVTLPAKEIVIALSLLTVGGIVLSGRSLGLAPALGLFAVFGLFHGSAFGDSIAAQETAMGTQVLVGYLIGLGITQYAIAVGAGWAALKLWHATASTAIQPRLAGAMVAGVGMFLVLENAEGILLGLLN